MWLFTGIILGWLLLGVIWWSKRNNLSLTWYEWLIGIIGFGLLLFTVQNFLGSFAELESQAAYMFLLVTGLPSLILLAIAWQLSVRRTKKA
ncbi:zinc ribbon domain-containing protein [Dehalococcoides mccartyi]|uniref:Zinc ribbon domain-containing protein n=1 Tax=Dehalococcoides mccartyi TaxID=61435 RepID=A0A2J1DQY7_9CHLR|nr:zinc ribbon domain-containing protein [Dehalococcoides mccartyi]